MLKLKSLRLSGIGRFVEPQDVDFENLGNLIQVDGENRNTNGSSGSGKSTLFNALDFLLGLNDLPTTVLQSRLTKEKLSVTGQFDWDGKALTITRAAKLIIDIDGEITTGSSALSEEKLDKILGMPRDMFRKLLHKRQKEGGFFLDFTPKKMYEFLTDALNLAAERKKLEKVEAKLSELEKIKIARQTDLVSIQSALRATQDGILSLGLAPVRDIHQSVIVSLKEKYDAASKSYKEIQEEYASQTKDLEAQRPHVTVEQYDSSERTRLEARRDELASAVNARIRAESDRVAGVKSSISALTLEQSKLQYQVRDGETCKHSATEIAGQVKKIRDAICPTCEQNWVTETAKAKEAELLGKLVGHKEKITEGAKATARLNVLATELADLQLQLKPQDDAGLLPIQSEIYTIQQAILADKVNEQAHMAKQNAANSSILQLFAHRQSELRTLQNQRLDGYRGQVEVTRMAFEAAANKLKMFNDAHTRYETSMLSMKEKEGQYQDSLTLIQENLRLTEREIEKATELKAAVKMFISISFDDALESIGEAATKIIRCIPTMSNATIQFEGQKETKDGKVKEEVNAVISMDGEVGIPIKSLSGGERSSVDLAVDLAVIDFVESESAKGIDVFILDEPFTGLDTVSIEMALEVLKNSNSKKKLIVVDHNPEVKEMVSNRLVVVREGTTSSITSQEVTNG